VNVVRACTGKPKRGILAAMKVWLRIMLLMLVALAVPAAGAAERAADKKECAFDEEREGNICYPRCKSTYVGDGDECVEVCPPNSQDYGNKCLMGPAAVLKKFYTRGSGRPIE
jgi:hypothetical protein